MRLEDKVAIITGSGSGIGRATAQLFAEEGAKVVVAEINLEGANETVQSIQSAGGEAVSVEADVSKEEDSRKIADLAYCEYGKIDILVNSAGAINDPVHFHKMNDSENEKYYF